MYFRRSLLLVESLAFIALTFSVSTTTRAADCKKFGKRVAALHLDLKSADSDILKQALRLALTTAHDDLETCRHPSPPLVPYSKVMPEAIGVPDPQIAGAKSMFSRSIQAGWLSSREPPSRLS